MAEAAATRLSAGEVWVLSRLLAGHDDKGATARLRPPWNRLAERLAQYPISIRPIGWRTLTANLPDGEAIVRAVAAVDPNSPRPDDGASDEGSALKVFAPACEDKCEAKVEAKAPVDEEPYVSTAAGRLRVFEGDDQRLWPAAVGPAAHQGLPGDLVAAIEPTTEADPVAILIQFLVEFGSLIGNGPRIRVDGHDHHANLFAVIVGDTSRARKGTSWRRVREALAVCDPTWAADRLLGGLSSGEGLIWAVRDPIMGVGKRNGEPVIVDHGVSDKRLLVVENEFGGALRVLGREGRTLSAVLRQAYDGDDLRFLTKNNPAASTAPHVALCGHVTREELAKHLSSVEAFNGLGNRILWVCARRSKGLPFGGEADDVIMSSLGAYLAGVADDARSVQSLTWAESGAARWDAAYDDLTTSQPGLLGAVTSRAEAHALRLAMIYALLDRRREIADDHVEAALAVWRYCADSAAFLFGRSETESKAAVALAALRRAPDGLRRADIHRNVFKQQESAETVSQILDSLVQSGRIGFETLTTGGRPAVRYFAR
jgi:Protein of unknown function (DUF3987)